MLGVRSREAFSIPPSGEGVVFDSRHDADTAPADRSLALRAPDAHGGAGPRATCRFAGGAPVAERVACDRRGDRSSEPEGQADAGEPDPFAEEYAEAEFFVQQGLFEDARHILENILQQAPGHEWAAWLLTQTGPAEPALAELDPAVEPPGAPDGQTAATDTSGGVYDIGKELSEEFGGSRGASARAPGHRPLRHDVLAEFKKALSTTGEARRTPRPTTISASPTRRWGCMTRPSTSSRWPAAPRGTGTSSTA